MIRFACYEDVRGVYLVWRGFQFGASVIRGDGGDGFIAFDASFWLGTVWSWTLTFGGKTPGNARQRPTNV